MTFMFNVQWIFRMEHSIKLDILTEDNAVVIPYPQIAP